MALKLIINGEAVKEYNSLNHDPQEYLKERRYFKEPITSPVKVIFLDFDGVLNNESFVYSHSKKVEKAYQEKNPLASAERLDPEAIKLLNEVIEATGAKVIVSSAWRKGRTICRLQELLEAKGFKGEVIGVTPGKNQGPRAEEIKYIVNKISANLTSFVIIDDDQDAEILGHFVKTSWKIGLSRENVDKAINILG